jgi:hypothetical protein
MTDYIFYQPVVQDSRVIEVMLDWAKANCPSYVTNDYIRLATSGDFYRLYFAQEKDFAWFQLRWSK